MLFAMYLLKLKLVPHGVSSAPDIVSISDSTISGIQKFVPSGGKLNRPATFMFSRTGDGSMGATHYSGCEYVPHGQVADMTSQFS